MSDLHIEVDGALSAGEVDAVRRAVEELVEAERRAKAVSPWKMTGRAAGTRNGIVDYRNRLGRESWSIADRLARAGQGYNGRHGRGDAK